MIKKLWNTTGPEPLVFYTVLLINLIPVLSFKFFPTLDGPAHLYNSVLINEMLGGNEVLESVLRFNPEPVPNWTGHFMLSVFNLLLPGWLSEKLLLCFYLAGLPLSFRYLVRAARPGNMYLSLLIFPFTYNFLLILGFYNFILSIVFLFLALGYWIKYKDGLNVRSALVFFVLLMLTYFSHVFVFATLCISLAAITGWQLITGLIDKTSRNTSVKVFFKQALLLLLIATPALILAWSYFSSRTLLTEGAHLPGEELLAYTKNLRPLISFSELEEQMYTRKIFYVISGLVMAALVFRVYKRDQRKLLFQDVFLLLGLFLVLLYVKLPDADSSGVGFVSIRMCLLFFLLVIVWIALQWMPKWIVLPAMALVLVLHAGKTKYYMSVMEQLSSDAREMNSMNEHIPENSTVYHYNFSDNWLQKHLSNYAGIDKPVLILENYEATLNWFPLMWMRDKMPSWQLGTTGLQGVCAGYYGNIPGPKVIAEYVLTWQAQPLNSDTCNKHVERILQAEYEPVHTSANNKATLYKLKK